MKANAPEKIYLFENPFSGTLYYRWLSKRCDVNDIEYIRKDAFIRKAVHYLKDHKEEVETEDNGITGWIPDKFIEGFVKYMKR